MKTLQEFLSLRLVFYSSDKKYRIWMKQKMIWEGEFKSIAQYKYEIFLFHTYHRTLPNSRLVC